MPTHPNNETALVEQVEMGDKDAFTALYNEHSQKVYRFALRLTGDHQEAEDVLQDAFLRAFVHLGEFRNEERFSTWLISIAGNDAFSRRRSAACSARADSADLGTEFDGKRRIRRDIQAHQDNAEETFRRIESQAILSRVMQKLNPSIRIVLSLRYERDLSTKATAKLLGISIPVVKTRLLRARLAARNELNQYSRVGPRGERRGSAF